MMSLLRPISRPALFAVLLGCATLVARAQNQTVNGNLTVTGTTNLSADLNVGGSVDQEGNNFTMGNLTGGYGVGQFYSPTATDGLRWRLRRSSAWLWEIESAGVASPAMRLDASNRLMLYSAGNATVTITPASQSLALGNATLTGNGTALATNGALTINGATTMSTLSLSSGSVTGSTAGLTLNAGGTNQNVALTPSGTGNIILNGNVGIGVNPPAGRLSIGEAGQVLNILTNKKLTGTWPATAEANTMTLQSSGASAGALAFANGNTESMRITTTGNVGIGTAAPTARLHLTGSTPTLRLQDSATGNVQHVLSASSGVLSVLADTSSVASANRAIRFGLVGTEYARLHTNGFFGVGSAAPAARLHVVATTAAETSAVAFTDTLRLQAAVGTSGGVNLQTAWDTATSSSKLNFRLGYFATTSLSRDLLTLVASTGNVGVNNTAPAATLDVAGTMKVSGTANFAGVVTVQPQGDLSMGEFTAQ